MKAQIEKKIDVTIILEDKDKELLYETMDLLEKIDDILTSNDFFDDDYFGISFKDKTAGQVFIKKQVYELDELRTYFDRFLW